MSVFTRVTNSNSSATRNEQETMELCSSDRDTPESRLMVAVNSSACAANRRFISSSPLQLDSLNDDEQRRYTFACCKREISLQFVRVIELEREKRYFHTSELIEPTNRKPQAWTQAEYQRELDRVRDYAIMRGLTTGDIREAFLVAHYLIDG
jgi:hypothetical protein